MTWNLVSLDDARPMAWHNGGGTTRELLAWPDAGEWRVRVSVAEVARAGPFSSYPGVRRHFLVLEGVGVRLAIDGVEHEVTPATPPLAFDGAAPVDATPLGGTNRDLNLMVRGGTGGSMRVLADSAHLRLRGGWAGVYSHEHPLLLHTAAGVRVVVPPRTLAWQQAARPGPLEASGRHFVWMEA